MSAGCGSIGREQSDPAPLQSNIMSRWSRLNCQHLFHKATRCIVLVQREEEEEGGAAVLVCIQGQPSLRLRVSSASQESTSNKTIDCQRLQCSTRGALCLVSFVCRRPDPTRWWLSQPEAQPVDAVVAVKCDSLV